MKHFDVTYKRGEIKFGMTSFRTVRDMVKHFEERPLMSGETGNMSVCQVLKLTEKLLLTPGGQIDVASCTRSII